MANQFQNMTEYTREFGRILHNKLTLIPRVTRGYDDRYAKTGAKIGDTLKIRLPNQYSVSTGRVAVPQDVVDSSVDLKVNKRYNVATQIDTQQWTLSLNDWSQEVATPVATRIAAEVEKDMFLDVVCDTYNQVGTPGTNPSAMATYLAVGQRLDEYLCPMDSERSLIISPAANAAAVDTFKGLFQSSERIADQYERGAMGQGLGFEFYRSGLVATITTGNKTTGVTVSGANQAGSTLVVGGLAAGDTFKRGQVFTIAGVKAINPETKTAYSYDQQFVITADVTASGATASLSIAPAIKLGSSTGDVNARDTVNSLPAASAALTFEGAANSTYRVGLGFHKEAIAFATADLVPLDGINNSSATIEGLRVRIARGSDILQDYNLARFDILAGWKVIRPEFATRLALAN
ncbi:P22 phage major capsid protein family protein [Acinetobacter nosocomialis]|uniref:P22 phage major capsid protein family protein n=1 Tax=Acinetobacter calcoaceticus/baumannii complex TaxID=909768 RepID=UPI001023EDB4|nr:P22 phage major capsid protein family protein [Acinetobacter pittii]RZG91663.1 hypothetical protein EXE08_16335 [Acinetobacter pittii]